MPTEDPTFPAPGQGFQFTELNGPEREDLVNLTIAPGPSGGRPFKANLFQLTALGANMDLAGSWYAPGISNIAHFHTVGSLGRLDHGVTVQRGYLFPFGHAAIATQIFQRGPGVDPATTGGGRYAVGYVQQQTFITVTQPVLSYPLYGQPWPNDSGAGFGAWNFPFSSVRIVSTASPPLDVPEAWWAVGPAHPGPPNPVPSVAPQVAWPTFNGGTPYSFSFILTDLLGTEIHCRMPIAFCFAADWESGYFSEFTDQDGLVTSYTQTSLASNLTWANTHARSLQYVRASAENVSTAHPTLALQFGATDTGFDPTINAEYPLPATESSLQAAVQPNFYPVLASAWIRSHAADVLSGKGVNDGSGPAGVGGGVQVGYYPGFVQGTEGTNNLVYLTFTNTPALKMPANNVGGVATPNFTMTGLSTGQGVFGGSPDTYAAQGGAQLADYFKPAETQVMQGLSQLLGGLQLADILDSSGFNTPSMTTSIDPTTGSVSIDYYLQTPLASWPTSSSTDGPQLLGSSPPPIFVPQGGNLTLQVDVTMDPETGDSTYTANGSIDPFDVWLLGNGGAYEFIHLEFTQFTFQGQSGSAPTVQVDLPTVEFVGVLSFVQTLEQFLQSFGLGSLTIDVEPDEVNASLSISLPTVAVGIFSLSGISFAAGITLPFVNGPAVATFAFASQDNPFTLTVSMFGGGGYIQLGLGFSGVQSFAASLDFCGQLAFDIGIASGSLSLSAGITYAWSTSTGASLTGWVKIAGSLEVFGIVTITATLELSLDYYPSSGVMQGTASFHASISVGCFSLPFGFSVTKSFGGSGSSPSIMRGMAVRPFDTPTTQAVTFSELCDSTDWAEYCDAFADQAPVT